ncbi:MAG: (2Fe-2S)-binding protein [Candidatus Latescibacterota bacterium]
MADSAEKGGGFSRRGFLRGLGGGLLGGAAAAQGWLRGSAGGAQAGEAGVLRGPTRIELEVNGQLRQLEVEPRTTLLDALRRQLGLTGTKEVCDRGQCGGCTVLLDGKPVLACMLLALDARGRRITTVEGLSAGGRLSAVQQAFVEQDGLMCGFCTPGMVMAATALLQANPHPTLEQIRQGLAGNLCRCGSYPRVCAAVQSAAQGAPQGAPQGG